MPDTNLVTEATPALTLSQLPPAPTELSPELARLLLQRLTSQLPAVSMAPIPVGVRLPTTPSGANTTGPAVTPTQGFFNRVKALPNNIPVIRGIKAGAGKVLSTAGNIGGNIANVPLKAIGAPGFSSVADIGQAYGTAREEIGKGANYLGGKALDAAIYPFRKLGLYSEPKLTNSIPTTATNRFNLNRP